MMNTSPKPHRFSLVELRSYEPHLSLTHVGDYDACIMVFAVDVALVAPLLPTNLELRPQAVTPAGQHPVLLFIGEQSRVRGELVPGELCPLLSPIGLCMNFLETAIAIPFVQQVGASAVTPDHFCSTRMVLNKFLPIYLGWLCGFPKTKGLLSATANSYDVKTESGDPLLDITFTPNGPFQSPSAFPYFAHQQPMFEQPHIGQLFSSVTELLATFICADIDLKLATAQIQSVSISGKLTNRFSTVLPNKFSFAGIKDDPLGAFRLRTTWELPPPKAC